ncbi:MAG TPA: hypothetical protein VEA36_01640 [Candidatus Paceibacterota bacterium]|nr:hypothetical protein [Candidatus Paceibacterota bacterium]
MVDHLAEVRALNLPLGTYIVAGGSCLDVKGIRTSDDIDIVVTPEVFEELKSRGWQVDLPFKEKWNRERLKHGYFEVYTDLSLENGHYTPAAEIIPKAELIEGLAFMRLDELIYWKRINGRPKDLEDIRMIEAYLQKTNA